MVWARQIDHGPEHQSLADTPTIIGSVSSSNVSPLSPSLPLSLQPFSSDSVTDTLTVPTSSNAGGTGSGTGSIIISSTSAVPTPSQSQGIPGSSAPSWTFVSPADAVTCQPYHIQWSISDTTPGSTDLAATDISLYVTNPGLNLTLVTNQHILNHTYTWSAVSLPAGTYTIQGIATGTHANTLANPAQSYMLSVKNGSDTSCVSSTGIASTPAQFASTPKSTNTAAIAGGVVGGILLVAFASLALWMLCRIRRENRRPGHAHGSGRGLARGLGNKDWNGLSSVDSKFPLEPGGGSDIGMGAGIAGIGAQQQLQHGGGGQQPHVARNVAPAARRSSSRDLDSTSSLEGEKIAAAKEVVAARDAAASATAGLPVLTRNGSWGSAINPYANDHGTGNGNMNAYETDSAAGHGAYGGLPVLPRAVELAYPPSRPSTGVTAPSRPTTATATGPSPRGSLDLTSDPFAAPATAVQGNGNNRRSSRTPRKPVPAYDPTDEEADAMAARAGGRSREQSRSRSSGSHGGGLSLGTGSTSTSTSPSSSPYAYQPSPLAVASQYQQQEQQHADAAALLHGEAMLHGLKSKASGQFEGQAVHYLIPDMPPPPVVD